MEKLISDVIVNEGRNNYLVLKHGKPKFHSRLHKGWNNHSWLYYISDNKWNKNKFKRENN